MCLNSFDCAEYDDFLQKMSKTSDSHNRLLSAALGHALQCEALLFVSIDTVSYTLYNSK